MASNNNDYTFGHFVGDFILGCCTGGLWWFWLVLKFLFKNS